MTNLRPMMYMKAQAALRAKRGERSFLQGKPSSEGPRAAMLYSAPGTETGMARDPAAIQANLGGGAGSAMSPAAGFASVD